MGTRTNYFIQKALDHIYLNTAITNIGDAAGLLPSAAAGNLYVALLDSTGTEVSYTGYQRIAIPRTGSGFARTGNVISNVAQLTFGRSSSGSTFATKGAIYDASTSGNMLHLQELPSQIYTGADHVPIIESGDLTITGE